LQLISAANSAQLVWHVVVTCRCWSLLSRTAGPSFTWTLLRATLWTSWKNRQRFAWDRWCVSTV